MKKIKDPLYGYISIDERLVPYIDSPEFQRLRNIRQTGYASLYPGALHNRFVHSLGVYYLGNKAISSFRNNVEKESGIEKKEWDKWSRTFELACLLHDVGHSPFSHTGEGFYDKQPGFRKILVDIFSKEDLGKFGKPHEVMSAIVGLDMIDEYEKGGECIDKELFVRCIIGALYSDAKEYLHPNAIIQMLNGSVIDVDKLDYLIRDAYVTGYDSVNLDVDRLLASYTVVDGAGKKRAGYKRGALSVIENVTYANDLERRWIQTNPTILYDCKLLENAIKEYDLYMQKKYQSELKDCANILCRRALSKEGFQGKKLNLRLLCDDDIITYFKNISQSEVSRQYFDRESRLIPMWKNEIDFAGIIGDELGDSVIQKLETEIGRLTDDLVDLFFINPSVKKEMLKEHKKEISVAKEQKMNEEKIQERVKTYERNMKIFELFEGFVKQEKLPELSFAIVSSNKYESNYKKLALENIYVELGKKRVERFSNTLTVNSVKSSLDIGDKIFYVYTSRKNRDMYAERKKDIGQVWAQYVSENWRRIYEE